MNSWKGNGDILDLGRRPLAETGVNGRPEENGNSQQNNSKEISLQSELEIIHRRLIEKGELHRLRDFISRTLFRGRWKHDVLNLCRAAVKKRHPSHISFEELYDSIKEEASNTINRDTRQDIILEVKNSFYTGSSKKVITPTE